MTGSPLCSRARQLGDRLLGVSGTHCTPAHRRSLSGCLRLGLSHVLSAPISISRATTLTPSHHTSVPLQHTPAYLYPCCQSSSPPHAPIQNIPTTPTSFYSKTSHRNISHCLQNRVLMLTFWLALIRMRHGLTTGMQYMPASLQSGNPERGWDEDSLHRLACYVLCVMLYICGLLLSSQLACNIKPPPLHR